MAEVKVARSFQTRRSAAIGAAVAMVGGLLWGIGLAIDPSRAWLSYLFALVCATTIAVGALIFHMIGYAANGRWMAVIRRVTELPMLALPMLALLFLPLWFGLDALYPWSGAEGHLAEHELAVLEHRSGYMNGGGFMARGVVYFAAWLIAAELLRRWSLGRDRQGEVAGGADASDDVAMLSRERTLSSALLPLVGLALTFAAFDWVMSLEAVWYSTMFGVYVFGGGFVAAIALVTVIAARIYRETPDGAITPHHFHALGRMLFAFVVFWAYCGFFQAMLIRIANKPEEVVYYLARTEGLWQVAMWVLIVGHFALPFIVLLSRGIKFRPRAMSFIGGWIVAMHLIDVYWMVVPARVHSGTLVHFSDLGALLAICGASWALAAWRTSGVAKWPLRDPFLSTGAAYRSKT